MFRRDPLHFLLLLLELLVVAVALGVFAHWRTHGLRTALWATGGERGWNSNPRLRIYYYANHQEPPEIPFLWTESLAESLLGIAIVNAAVWATRVALACSGVSLPLVGAFYDLLLSGLWTFGVNAQTASDLTDPRHLSPRPWYLERSCAGLYGQDGATCRQGKTSFAVAVICMVLYFVRSVGSVLRLAYWCGEYRVLDKCAEWIGECWTGPKQEKAGGSRFYKDRPLMERGRISMDGSSYLGSESD